MTKRFKSKKKNRYRFIKIICLLCIIYISFNLIYNLIYNLYLSKLSNEEIIAHIIKNTKNAKSSNLFLEKYQNPKTILSDNFTFKEENTATDTVEVNNNLDKEISVYIYNTHETESYDDKYLEVYNIKPTVNTMSYILKDYLNDLGVNVLIETRSVSSILKKNKWSYKYSYDASKELITPVIEANKNLKLVIDLHRDSAPLSKTKTNKDNVDYAKILFVVGAEHSNYKENHEVAKKLSSLLENEVEGISRGISLKSGAGVNGIYNQDLSTKSVLIELGGQYNEIEELNNSLKVLSRVILKYLEGES